MKSPLTPTERTIAELLLRGLPNAAIARSLHRSSWTIKQHFGNMFRKFDLHHHGLYMPRLKLAMLIHEWREILGVRCESCEHLRAIRAAKIN